MLTAGRSPAAESLLNRKTGGKREKTNSLSQIQKKMTQVLSDVIMKPLSKVSIYLDDIEKLK